MAGATFVLGSAAHQQETAVDVQEIKKLDAYLKKLFGNPTIRVVPKKSDSAEIFVGEDDRRRIDRRRRGGRAFLQCAGWSSSLGGTPASSRCRRCTAYLRRKFGNENIRVVTRPKKTEFAGSLSSARNFSACCSPKTKRAAVPTFSSCRFSTSI